MVDEPTPPEHSGPEVRRLAPADFDAYYEVHLAGLEERPAAFTTDADAWRGAPRETLERHLAATRDMPVLGALDQSGLVGLLGLSREERRSVAHKAAIWGFYVLPENRRQGVGRKLLNEAISWATATAGLRQIRAVVATSCTEALALFEDIGFEHFGLEREARWVDGAFHDTAYLWYRLPRSPDDGR